jgi:hypothetical protein
MQEMPAEWNAAMLSPIYLISHNRAFQEGTMQSDLMGASRQWMKLEEGMVPEAFESPVF